jgi:hypothetical protein
MYEHSWLKKIQPTTNRKHLLYKPSSLGQSSSKLAYPLLLAIYNYSNTQVAMLRPVKLLRLVEPLSDYKVINQEPGVDIG